MIAVITLSHDLESIHHDLGHRLSLASTARPDARDPRHHYAAIDTFLAAASRHTGGMVDAIVPRVRGLPDGRVLAHDYLAAARAFEESLAQVKAKLYGSTFAGQRSWAAIWQEVADAFGPVCSLEREMADALRQEPVDDRGRLTESGDPSAREDLSDRLHRAELKAPTRPHPFIPHQGLSGHLARRVARRVDQFWDTTEGRMVPEPVRHHDRDHQGRFTQYLLADPHLPEDEERGSEE